MGKIKKKKGGGGSSGWLLWRLEGGAGAASWAVSCLLRGAPVLRRLLQGLGLALAAGTPPGCALRAALGESGGAAQLLTGIAAGVCSNVFPCVLQLGMRPDVLHSWKRSR